MAGGERQRHVLSQEEGSRALRRKAASSEEIAWVLREYGDDFQDAVQEAAQLFIASVSPRTTWKPKG